MIETVVKRNGKEEAFSPEKLNGWGMFAAKTLPKGSVDWGSVVMQVVSGMGDKVTTKELQDALIKNCINRNTYEYSRMAGRLYASALPKEFYPKRKHPTLKELHEEMIKEGLIVKPNYSDEEYEELDKIIDHRKDYTYSYAAIRQLVNKMAVQNRITGKKFETPQFIFMRVVMQAYNNYKEADRMEHIRNMYNLISDRKINVPTPYYTNSLTHNPNTSSCAVVKCSDTAESIGVFNALGYMLTVSSAGIGAMMTTRSINDGVRGNAIRHLGKVPYYRAFAETIKSSMQQCYDDQTEILTSNGWKPFDDLEDTDMVAQVHNDLSIDFVKPLSTYKAPYKGNMIRFHQNGKWMDVVVTPNHRMMYKQTKHVVSDLAKKRHADMGWKELTKTQYVAPDFSECLAEDFNPSRLTTMYMAGKYKGGTVSEFTELDRLMVAYQGDGFIRDGNVTFHVAKERKAKRLIAILEKLGVEYKSSFYEKDKTYLIRTRAYKDELNLFTKDFSSFNLLEKTPEWCYEFLHELIYWDGSELDTVQDALEYFNTNEAAIDFVQMAAAISGAYSRKFRNPPQKEHHNTYWGITVSWFKDYICSSKVTKENRPYDGYVYCVEVPSGIIVTRRNGFVHVGGNSRSGAATMFYPFFDPEIITLLSLKNPMSTPANRVRNMDYSISLNNWMVIRAAKKQPVWLFSYKDNPDLYELFYSGDVEKFGEEMEKFAKEHPDKVEEINAMELLSHAVKESMETGRIYLTFIDEMNRHTPFKHSIYSSNLCCFWEDETFGVYEGKDAKISRTVSFKELHNLIKSGKEFYIPSFNEKTKEMEIKRITNSALMRSGADVYTMKYTISYSGGVHNFSGNIHATEDHKFLLESGEWKEMKDLIKGDLIRSYDGQTVEFQSMEFFKVADVYDIEVEDNHNFFIRNVLASNCEISLSTKGYEKYEDLHYRVNPQKEFTRHDGSKGVMGEVAFCNLAGIVVSNIKTDEEYADAAYYALSLIESGIDNSSHAFPALEQAIRYRRSAGVGIMSLAHLMAKKNKKYSTQEGKDFIHEVFETHAWHLTKASLRLAKERGVCEGMEVSKYKDGWLPIDTYNRNVDELVTVENKRDWEGLRKEIIENGGIRHSTVCTEMPGESCLSKDTKIVTILGEMSLEDIFNKYAVKTLDDAIAECDKFTGGKWYDLKEPIMVLTSDGKYYPVERIFYNSLVETIDIEMEDGSTIRATHHHKFLIRRNGELIWEMAMNLKDTDEIMETQYEKKK